MFEQKDTGMTKPQMRLGLSMRYLGCHDAAWQHPDVPTGGSSDYHRFLRCPDTAAQLGIAVNAPIAYVRRVFRAPDGTVPYLGEVTYCGDLVQLEMNLAP